MYEILRFAELRHLCLVLVFSEEACQLLPWNFSQKHQM